MPFLLLLVLTLIYLQGSQGNWPEPFFGTDGRAALTSVLITWGGMGFLIGAADWMTRGFVKLLRQDPSQSHAVLRRFSRWRRYHLYGLLAFFGIALYALGWGWSIGAGKKGYLTSLAGPFPGRELIVLLPFFTVLVYSWARYYDLERAGREEEDPSFPGRWAYLSLQVRHNLLLLLPPLVLFLIQETILTLVPGLENNPLGMWILAGCLVAGVFVTIPWIIRLILRLRPLPDCPLRSRLVETARRLGFRCNNILLWNTRSTVANAMVTGPLPFLRYVILTDRLIEELQPEEVEAVFGHEVGHVKHHHMMFYFGFVLASLGALEGIWKIFSLLCRHESVRIFLENYVPLAGVWDSFAALPLLLVVALYIFLVFGFLSRRCERQADIFGCRTVSCPIFIEALEKVAQINGIPRERPGWLSSWQHSTIARRVEFLQRLHADPALETTFQRRVGLFKWGVVLSLITVLLAVYSTLLVLLNQGKVWAVFL